MREIKFRQPIFDTNGVFEKWHYWGLFDVGGNFSYTPPMDRHYFDREKLTDPLDSQQFTGLHDKNGMEIYEGDIVNVTNKGIYNGLKVVVLDDTILCYVLVFASEYRNWVGTQGGLGYLKVSSGIKCELIGNIYETPELLNNKQ